MAAGLVPWRWIDMQGAILAVPEFKIASAYINA